MTIICDLSCVKLNEKSDDTLSINVIKNLVKLRGKLALGDLIQCAELGAERLKRYVIIRIADLEINTQLQQARKVN